MLGAQDGLSHGHADAHRAVSGMCPAVKALEDMRQLFPVHARSAVCDLQRGMHRRLPCPYADRAVDRRVFGRVLEDVEQGLAAPARISAHLDAAHVHVDLDLLVLDHGGERLQRAEHKLLQRDLRRLEGDGARVHARQLEQGGDQPFQPVQLLVHAAEELLALRFGKILLQQFVHHAHGSQRRAQLMRDVADRVGQEEPVFF